MRPPSAGGSGAICGWGDVRFDSFLWVLINDYSGVDIY
jgi:hypothetical protein